MVVISPAVPIPRSPSPLPPLFSVVVVVGCHVIFPFSLMALLSEGEASLESESARLQSTKAAVDDLSSKLASAEQRIAELLVRLSWADVVLTPPTHSATVCRVCELHRALWTR